MHIVKTHQRHTRNVKCVKEKSEEPELCSPQYTNTDGLITNKPDIMLATTNADCILMRLVKMQSRYLKNRQIGI